MYEFTPQERSSSSQHVRNRGGRSGAERKRTYKRRPLQPSLRSRCYHPSKLRSSRNRQWGT